MGVGAMLSEHGSALDVVVASQMKSAVVADAFAKDLAIERTKRLLALPPTRMVQNILAQVPGAEGEPEYRIVKFDLLVPTFIMVNNEPFVITKYAIHSTFEAMIKKTMNVKSETDVSVSGKAGFLGIPSIGFDITEKLTVDSGSESTQHNTFDIDIEMGQGQSSVGYIEIVKAFTRCVNKVVDFVCTQGLENPVPIDESEAGKLQEEAAVPVHELEADGEKAVDSGQ